jgi:hypothetical protein
MARPIDHLVHCVGDLAAARELHRRIGFTTTPEARHPFGTGNSLVQLQGSFIEMVAIADAAAIAPPASGHFSFAAYNAEFLARRRGLSMLVFESADARRDHADFLAKGLDTYAPFDFERRARLPDGSEATVGFSLAFVTHPDLPEAAFFVCQQRAPQYFWKPEYQRHANTAQAVEEVVMTAPDPDALAPFFARLQGEESVSREAGAIAVATGRGRILVLDKARAGARFPGLAEEDAARFLGYRLRVADLAAAARALREGGVPHRRIGDALQIAAADNFGAALELAAG